MEIAERIQEMVDLETRGWDTKNPDLFLSMIHPDMAWPWPPTADAHDPIDWAFVLGRFDRERWRKSWQELFDSHDLIHNRRTIVRIEISREEDAAFAVVDIATAAAQKEMVSPALLAIIAPIAVGLLLGPSAVVGMLMSSLATGFILAVFMANAGGSWDNAKKHIEGGKFGGKGSDAHKAAVTGDTVGDPLKDTSGPSINILLKLMSMVSIVFAGVVVANFIKF